MPRHDPLELRARELCLAASQEPDTRIPKPGEPEGGRTMPAWTSFRQQARDEQTATNTAQMALDAANIDATRSAHGVVTTQDSGTAAVPLTVLGKHEQGTLDQMRACMGVGHVAAGVICADGHIGYAQPVGGVIGYVDQISVSGVGFDIACGNMAVRLDVPFSAVEDRVDTILADIRRVISFGVGRTNDERVSDPLFDNKAQWQACGMEDYRQKSQAQLGTVGGGNHYVDLLRDENDMVWVGVHFGSRGTGHTIATRHLKLAGGRDGMFVPPTVLRVQSELGQSYLSGMDLAGRYAYAGRRWVVERVRQIIGGKVEDTVHNHHNFAFQETHSGQEMWVVRKGATPAFPGQRGFIGGSMGDDAVIVQGLDTPEAKAALHSTIHGAGRMFGRREAKRQFTREQMDAWLHERGVRVSGGDVDESPMAYRRLPEVLAHHEGSVKVLHTLRPFAVAMAGPAEYDPWKD